MCRAKRSARIRVCGALWSGNSRSSECYRDHFLSQSPQYQAAGSLIWLHTHAFVGPGIFFFLLSQLLAICPDGSRLDSGEGSGRRARVGGCRGRPRLVRVLQSTTMRSVWCAERYLGPPACACCIAVAPLTGAERFSGGEMKMYGWLYCETH